MNLRAAAIHALSLHHPAIMGHTEYIQSYVVTGDHEILTILPDVGLEGDELAQATALIVSGGQDLVDDFPLVSPKAEACELPAGVAWAVGLEMMPDSWPSTENPEWYPIVARAYVVRAIASVYPDTMAGLRGEQLLYVNGGANLLLEQLVAAGVSQADADRLAILMDVEGDVFPFDLGLSGILNGDGGEEEEPAPAGLMAAKILGADDKFDTPAFFAGHFTTSHARQAVHPYTISRRFRIDDVSAGTHYVLGDTDSGEGFWKIVVLPNGSVRGDFVNANIGNQTYVTWPAGTVVSGADVYMHARSEGLAMNRRMGSLRINGVNGMTSSLNSNGRAGGLSRGTREGNNRNGTVAYGITVWGAADMKARATDAHCDAIDAAASKAALLLAAQAVDPNAGEWQPDGETDLAVTVVNSGAGGNASTSGMNNAENLGLV